MLTTLVYGCTDRAILAVTVGEIIVDPGTASLLAGDTIRFRATVRDVDGRTLPRASVTWFSEGGDVASVDAAGLVTAVASGSTRVRAEFRGVTGASNVTVLQPPTIRLSQDTVALFGAAALAEPAPVAVEVRNAGGGNLGGLTVNVQYPPGQPTGWVDLALGDTDAPTTLAFGAEIDGLAVGMYDATVLLGSPDDATSPVFIPVTLSLTGLTVTESDDSTVVSESGTSDSVTVRLDGAPEEDVVFSLSIADAAEAVVSPTSIRFTRDDWDTPQTIVVTGQDDLFRDGDVNTQLIIGVVDSESDDRFDPIPDVPVRVRSLDDDAAGITFAESDGGTIVDESGASDAFSVVLDAAPLSPVVFDVVATDPTEVAASPASLTFTPEDWSAPQSVTVTGVDDVLIDGPVSSAVRVTVDPVNSDDGFDTLAPDSVMVTTVDNDTPGFSVAQTAPTPPVTDSTYVTEAGTTDTFTIVLDARPDGPVTFAVSSADEGEVIVEPSSLSFGPDDWAIPMTVTVTGVDDALIDLDQVTDVTVSVDADATVDSFDGVPPRVVPVITADNDDAAFVIAESDGGTSVTEAGATDAFSVALGARPVDDVVLNVSSADGGEVTATPLALTFTAGDWNVPQTVTVAGVDERIDDGDQSTAIVIAVDAGASDEDFAGLADSVAVTTVDDDTAGFTIVESDDGTLVTEDGGTDDFSVELTSEPTSDVVLTFFVSDTTELSVSPTTLTFTPADWDEAQTVTVTGVDDGIVDGFQTSIIAASVLEALSDDAYDAVAERTVNVTTTDNDVPAGIIVQTGGAITLTEGGTSDQFTIELVAPPFENVILSVTSGDPSEVSVTPTTFTFTPSDWDGARSVTVTGVDDDVIDGAQLTAITVSVGPGSDASYLLVPDTSVSVTTLDNDGPGFTLGDASGKSVTEAGGTDAFTVVLDAQPASDVVLSLAASDPTEVALDVASVTFTATDWSEPRSIVLRGVDDDAADGSVASTVTVSIDVGASDPAFGSVPDQTVGVTTSDNDAVGLAIEDFGGVSVSESGTTDAFEVRLTAEPSDSVVVRVTSGDPGEASAGPGTLIFRPSDWSTPRSVTVTGVDDAIQDGDQTSSVLVSVDAPLSDPAFGSVPDETVSVTTTDDDDVGFTVSESGSTIVSEDGTSDPFSVVLDAQPQPGTEVVMSVSSADLGEVTVSPSTLTFTFDDWNVPQDVTVTGVDDVVLDGSRLTAVTLSIDDGASDPAFSLVPTATVNVTTTDNDVAAFTLANAVGKTVNENGSADAFSVVLGARPLSAVVLTVASGDPGEGAVAPTTLTFLPAVWNVAQQVTVTGVDDAVIDGPQDYTVSVSVDAAASDPAFGAVAPQSVAVTTLDDDASGFSVSEFGGVRVNEGGSTDDFDVVLTARPATDVVLTISNPDPGEVDVAPSSLTFGPSNWSGPQTVTVTGIDDAVNDGDVVTTLVVSVDEGSSDPAFAGLPDATVDVTTTDDDGVGFSVAEINSTVVSEDGTTDEFTVVLDAQPQPGTQVVFLIGSGDTGEATVSPANLTFTPADWSVPKVVQVFGIDDAVVDGDQVTTVDISVGPTTTDPTFATLPDASVNVTTLDNDVSGFLLTGTSGKSVSEAGTTDQFFAALSARPASAVILDIVSSDPGEATVAPASVVFGPDDWETPQAVTLTGVDDALLDGPQPVLITVSVDPASDPSFASLPTQTVAATNADNDGAGFSVDDFDGISVSESGIQDNFQVVLDAEPASSVVLTVVSLDASEASVSAPFLTFTPANWDDPQTIVITGIDDAIADGTQVIQVVVSVDDGASDPAFSSLPDIAVAVTNVDNDGAGLTLGSAVGKTVTEAGTTDFFTVVLDAQPAPGTEVVLDVFSGDPGEVVVDPTRIVFDPGNWSTAQQVQVTGVDDAIVDGPQISTISLIVDDIASDPTFALVPNASVAVTTDDDDAAGFALGGTAALSVSESGTTDAFSVVLTARPATPVVLSVISADGGEAAVLPTTVTFQPGAWDVPQTVTITGVDDPALDGDQSVVVTVSVDGGASDPGFATLPSQAFDVTVADDDTAGFTFADFGGVSVNEAGSTDNFDVVLTAQPMADVVITVVSTDLGEATVDVGSLTFTSANWSTPRRVTVTGVDDAFADSDQVTTVVLAVDDGASDPAWGSLPDQTVSVTTMDDDGVGFSITEVGSTIVTESGSTDEFAVALDVIPSSDVVLLISSADVGEATVAPSTLTFTPTTWSEAQVVTVTGVADGVTDGDVETAVSITVDVAASDPAFAGVSPGQVIVTTVDRDGSVSGLVFDDRNGNGAPDVGEAGFSGVTVNVTDSGASLVAAVTDAGGVWIADGLAAGPANVDIVGATLPPGAVQTAGSDPSGVTVVSGIDTDAGFDGYQQRGGLDGTVFEDLNGNGTQDGAEPGLAAITVDIMDSQGGMTSATTDGTGSWSLTDLPVGDADVDIDEATLPVGSVQTSGTDPETIVVPAGASGAAGVDGFQRQGAATGLVFEDTDGNGVQDGAEAGITGVTVTVSDSQGSVQVVATGPTGAWSASGLAIGLATVDVDEATLPAGAVPTAGTDPSQVTVLAGQTEDAGKDGYQLTGDLTGTVFADLNGNGSVDAGELGLAAIGIDITDSQGVTSSTVTDINGSWTMVGLPTGLASVDVDDTTLPAGSVATAGLDPSDASVAAGVTTDAGTDGFQQQGSASGRVFEDTNGNGVEDAGEAGIAGVTVNVIDRLGAVHTATTDAAGAWLVVGVPNGPASVDVDETTLPGAWPRTVGDDPTAITIVPNTTVDAGVDGFDPAG